MGNVFIYIDLKLIYYFYFMSSEGTLRPLDVLGKSEYVTPTARAAELEEVIATLDTLSPKRMELLRDHRLEVLQYHTR